MIPSKELNLALTFATIAMIPALRERPDLRGTSYTLTTLAGDTL